MIFPFERAFFSTECHQICRGKKKSISIETWLSRNSPDSAKQAHFNWFKVKHVFMYIYIFKCLCVYACMFLFFCLEYVRIYTPLDREKKTWSEIETENEHKNRERKKHTQRCNINRTLRTIIKMRILCIFYRKSLGIECGNNQKRKHQQIMLALSQLTNCFFFSFLFFLFVIFFFHQNFE